MPSKSKPIKITITSGVKGQAIVVRNRTTGESINTTLGATAKAQVDLQNFTSGYTEGDVIDIMVSGEKVGAATLITSGDGGQSVTVSTAAMNSSVVRGVR